MRLLANENVPFQSADVLKAAGFDVKLVGVEFAGVTDREVHGDGHPRGTHHCNVRPALWSVDLSAGLPPVGRRGLSPLEAVCARRARPIPRRAVQQWPDRFLQCPDRDRRRHDPPAQIHPRKQGSGRVKARRRKSVDALKRGCAEHRRRGRALARKPIYAPTLPRRPERPATSDAAPGRTFSLPPHPHSAIIDPNANQPDVRPGVRRGQITKTAPPQRPRAECTCG